MPQPLSARSSSPSRALALIAVGVAAAALVASSAPANASPLHLAAGPWAHYDTGRVNVVYPSQLPIVQLVQDANSSFTATLAVSGVYEVAPGGLPTPTIVAAAFPSSLAAFNGSPAGGAAGAPFSMFANLAVYPTHAALWAAGSAVGPIAGPIGAATLAIAFSPTPSSPTAAGVAVNWTVVGWPWTSTSDLLAIAFSFDYASGDALTACQVSPLASSPMPPCFGHSIEAGESAWGSNYASLEGEGGGGPVARIAWSDTIQFGTSTSPVTMGALAANPGSSELVLMGTGAGTGPVASTLDFSLIAPSVVLSPVVLSGNALAYALSAVGLGAAATAGIVGYRRHERRIRDEL